MVIFSLAYVKMFIYIYIHLYIYNGGVNAKSICRYTFEIILW